MTGFHAAAWLTWAAGATAIAVAVDNPIVSLAVVVSAVLVASWFATDGPEAGAMGLMLRLGVIILAVRIVLFGLTGHTGDTVLFTLPSASLPVWLGGLTIGGSVTAEVFAQNVAEGLKIMALLAVAGAMFAVVETYRIIRLLPRSLFEAGLIVGIAVAFVPTLLRTFAEVRDAQRLRGHRARGVRSLRPVVMPVLAGGLERALGLAAAMETRGFGRHPATVTARARLLVLVGVVSVAVGGGLWLMGTLAAPPGIAFVVAGLVATGSGMRAMGAGAPRTRYRPEPFVRRDGVLVAIAVLTIAGAFAARSVASARWYPYPAFTWPAVDLRLVLLGLAPMVPVVIAALRGSALRRASVRASEPATLEVTP